MGGRVGAGDGDGVYVGISVGLVVFVEVGALVGLTWVFVGC